MAKVMGEPPEFPEHVRETARRLAGPASNAYWSGELAAEFGRRWRTGRKVGRTIYRQWGPEPSDDDLLIGVMDTPEIARAVVDSVNAVRGLTDHIAASSDTPENAPQGQ